MVRRQWLDLPDQGGRCRRRRRRPTVPGSPRPGQGAAGVSGYPVPDVHRSARHSDAPVHRAAHRRQEARFCFCPVGEPADLGADLAGGQQGQHRCGSTDSRGGAVPHRHSAHHYRQWRPDLPRAGRDPDNRHENSSARDDHGCDPSAGDSGAEKFEWVVAGRCCSGRRAHDRRRRRRRLWFFNLHSGSNARTFSGRDWAGRGSGDIPRFRQAQDDRQPARCLGGTRKNTRRTICAIST